MRPFVMISASIGNEAMDVARNSALQSWLCNRYDTLSGLGSYQGLTELCFQVFTTDTAYLLDKARTLQQESILVVTDTGSARLVYTDGRPDTEVGVWQLVTQDVALASPAWTLIRGKYYVATPTMAEIAA